MQLIYLSQIVKRETGISQRQCREKLVQVILLFKKDCYSKKFVIQKTLLFKKLCYSKKFVIQKSCYSKKLLFEIHPVIFKLRVSLPARATTRASVQEYIVVIKKNVISSKSSDVIR